MKYTKLFLPAVLFLASCAAPATPEPIQTLTPEPTQTLRPEPTATQAALNDTSSSAGDCTLVLGSYDLPHTSTKAGGQELYDLAEKEPSDTYLELKAVVTEAAHLVAPNDGVDGTLIFANIDDVDGNTIYRFAVLIYLPDGGAGVGQITADSRITASGLYVGYVYPPEDLFVSFPNHAPKTKFPSIKAETAAYGCD